MNNAVCHAPTETAKAAVKGIILRELGVGRVADWCGVSEASVYQWLSRGSEDAPIPPTYVPAIIQGAAEAGVVVDEAVLWPAMAKARERVAQLETEGEA